MESGQDKTTEIIAFGSGKGGTGKTIIASSLGYALIRSGHRVLMVDSDPATDGLSLFLLGPKGSEQTESFKTEETFTGLISQFNKTGELVFNPRSIHRSESGDHGISYRAIISGKALYGDLQSSDDALAVPDLDQKSFREAVERFFGVLRSSGQFDYILVDTRGGFAFESTDVCALADSFIVVTEPNYTSFYQDRNLVKRISAAAKQLHTRPVLRSIIVNKATEGESIDDARPSLEKLEASFRLELEREFPLKFRDTHAVPLDIEAIKAYKLQQMPYVTAPASPFSFATLSAFHDILQVVTSRWGNEQVAGWNVLIETVSAALEKRYEDIKREKQEAADRIIQLAIVKKEVKESNQRVSDLEREIARLERQYERELDRTKIMLSPSTSRMEELSKIAASSSSQRLRRRNVVLSFFILLSVLLVAVVGWRWYQNTRVESLLTSVYNQSLPPALRTKQLFTLRDSFNQRNLDAIQLSGMNLDQIDLYHVSLRAAVLRKTSLRNSRLTNADLSGADLSEAMLDGADLRGANLSRADLRAAALNRADLENADLTDANLTEADLRGANLRKANLSNAQLESALTDKTTTLPDGTQAQGPLSRSPVKK